MRAIVTGAASGIGLAVAHRLNADSLARESRAARLVLIDRSAEGLAQAEAALRGEGAEVEVIAADLADPAVPADAVNHAMRTLDGLDALVSNAGILCHGTLLDLSLEEYERTFAVNTRPGWLLAKAAYPHLKAARGAMVATASLAAHHPISNQGAYSASKAALLMMMRQLAHDWAPDGIRVNTVSPGATSTGIAGFQLPATLTEPGGAPGVNPMGFVSQARDQAAVICFLVGPDARFVTGSDFIVDGGAQTTLLAE